MLNDSTKLIIPAISCGLSVLFTIIITAISRYKANQETARLKTEHDTLTQKVATLEAANNTLTAKVTTLEATKTAINLGWVKDRDTSHLSTVDRSDPQNLKYEKLPVVFDLTTATPTSESNLSLTKPTVTFENTIYLYSPRNNPLSI